MYPISHHFIILTLSILITSYTYGQSSQNSIPYPENKLTFSAYLSDSYVQTYCDYLQKEYTTKNEITRTRLYSIAWNGICSPWLARDGYKVDSRAMDYYFIKLQSLAYAHCQILRDHFHLIFDYPNAANDTLVQQHRKMIDILALLEDTSSAAGFKADLQYQKSILTFRHTLKLFSPLLFFNIKHKEGKTYQIEYYYFNPAGNIEWPFDSRNLVMRISFILYQDSINEFTLNTDFERFNWLSAHIDDLKSTIDISKPPGPPPPIKN